MAAAALAASVGCSSPTKYVEWPRSAAPAPEAPPAAVAARDAREAFARVVVHSPFGESRCGECHVAETGGGALVAGSEGLCLRCHADGIRRARPHPGARSCLGCHARHVSMTPGRLTGGEDRMCTRCHDPSARRIASVHGGTLDAATCTRCHDPHGSGRGALILQKSAIAGGDAAP